MFTVPPSSVPNIGDALLAKQVSFAYFGDQFNAYLANPFLNYVSPDNTYCNICNFFQYSTSIMTNAPVRQAALKDTTDLYNDLQSGNLPAVSFVKPDGYLDGHPASSKVNLLEGFVKKIVDLTKANPKLWANTAIFITMDEGGGYYDSGYVQALDYLWRRDAHPDDRGVEIQHRRAHLAHLYRSRLDLEIHRGELERAADHQPQPRQSAGPGDRGRSLQADKRAGDRRPDGPLQLPLVTNIGGKIPPHHLNMPGAGLAREIGAFFDDQAMIPVSRKARISAAE